MKPTTSDKASEPRNPAPEPRRILTLRRDVMKRLSIRSGVRTGDSETVGTKTISRTTGDG